MSSRQAAPLACRVESSCASANPFLKEHDAQRMGGASAGSEAPIRANSASWCPEDFEITGSKVAEGLCPNRIAHLCPRGASTGDCHSVEPLRHHALQRRQLRGFKQLELEQLKKLKQLKCAGKCKVLLEFVGRSVSSSVDRPLCGGFESRSARAAWA